MLSPHLGSASLSFLCPDCPSNLSDIWLNTIYSGVAYLTPNVVSSLSSMLLLLLTVHLQSPDHIFIFTCLCGYLADSHLPHQGAPGASPSGFCFPSHPSGA